MVVEGVWVACSPSDFKAWFSVGLMSSLRNNRPFEHELAGGLQIAAPGSLEHIHCATEIY